MTESQHKLFNMLVQSACESRANLHEVAWTLLGALMVVGLIMLAAAGIWILNGGFSKYCYLNANCGRRVNEDWLREP
jgi:hypothetical protein